jgi:hypothetical protein
MNLVVSAVRTVRTETAGPRGGLYEPASHLGDAGAGKPLADGASVIAPKL